MFTYIPHCRTTLPAEKRNPAKESIRKFRIKISSKFLIEYANHYAYSISHAGLVFNRRSGLISSESFKEV